MGHNNKIFSFSSLHDTFNVVRYLLNKRALQKFGDSFKPFEYDRVYNCLCYQRIDQPLL